jgi:hypothetical protein
MMVKCFNTTRRQGPLPKRKFQARKLVHESVDFVDHKCASEISKNFPGLYPRTLVNRGREKAGEVKGKGGKGEGRDGITKKGEREKGGKERKHSPGFIQHPRV